MHLSHTICYKLIVLRDKIHEYTKNEFKEFGITYGNYVTLSIIYEHPGITQAKLAELNHKDKNVIVQTIDKLEKNQYVQRVRDEKDRRAYTLQMTPDGEAVINCSQQIVANGEKKLLQRLTEKEQQQFMALLDKLYGEKEEKYLAAE